MNKVVKWILGILAVLVVLAVVAGIGLLIYNRWHTGGWMMGGRDLELWGRGRHMPMLRNWGMPMAGRGFFFPLRVLGALFFPCLLVLIIGGIAFWFGRMGRNKAVMAPAVPVKPAEVVEPVQARICPTCSRVMNNDWSNCPYDGTALT